MKKLRLWTAVSTGFVSLILSFLPSSVYAQDLYWVCDGTALWNSTYKGGVTGNCWATKPSGVGTVSQPLAGDNIFLTQSGANNLTVRYWYPEGPTDPKDTANYFGHLLVEGTGKGNLTLSYTSNHSLFVQGETIGDTGRGAVNQTDGNHYSLGIVILGKSETGIGSFSISNSGTFGTAVITAGLAGTGILDIGAGGLVSSLITTVGDLAGSAGLATVDGQSAHLISTLGLNVGNFGTGILNIQNGGSVTTEGAGIQEHDKYLTPYGSVLGAQTGSTGTATVDAGTWENQYLQVGYSGIGNLNIQNGGEVISRFGAVGVNAGSTGTVIVNGAGSIWDNADHLNDGDPTVNNESNLFGRIMIGEAGTGSLDIQNGGRVASNSGGLGVFAGSIGSVTVTGAGSRWDNVEHLLDDDPAYGTITVGEAGTGTMNINNGGWVGTDNGILGVNAGSTGTVTVSDAGSMWRGKDLIVGSEGSGTFNINNGGTLELDNNLMIGEQGTVSLNGGVVIAKTIDTTATGSRFNFTGGTLDVNTFNGNLVNQGGTLALDNSLGLNTINGDYTQDINGIFAVEIGGLLSGTEYDSLNVTGSAVLGGTLDVDWLDLGSGLFEASLGDSFDILSAETFLGEFDLFTLAVLNDGLDWQLDYLIDEIGSLDVMRLSVVSSVPVPAAVWLFGSGLIGLVGVARHKKA